MFTGLDFTTLPRVRNVLAFPEDDTSRDAELSRLIRSVSADMEGELRRFAKTAAYVEILPVWPPSRIISLQGFPVLDSPAPELLLSSTRDFTTGFSTLVRGQDYVLENETGRIRIMSSFNAVTDSVTGRALGPTYAKVSYTGGLALTPEAMESAYPQLAEAAELQVVYCFKRQTTPGGNILLGQNSTAFEQPYNWLPSVRRVLEYFKRRSIH